MSANIINFWARVEKFRTSHAVLLVLPQDCFLSANLFSKFVFSLASITWSCTDLETESHPDIEIAPSLVVRDTLRKEDVSKLKELSQYPPATSSKRVLVVENAERLLPAAANSLLKCVEEPQAKVLWLFTCFSARNVLPTIQSRCVKIFVPRNVFESESEMNQRTQEPNALSNLFHSIVFERKLSKNNTLSSVLKEVPKISKEFSSLSARDEIALALAESAKKRQLSWEEIRALLADLRTWKDAELYNVGLQNLLMKFFLKLRTL